MLAAGMIKQGEEHAMAYLYPCGLPFWTLYFMPAREIRKRECPLAGTWSQEGGSLRPDQPPAPPFQSNLESIECRSIPRTTQNGCRDPRYGFD